MSLLDRYAKPCVIMEKKQLPDGEGGWLPQQWAESVEFINYQAVSTSAETQSAEKQEVKSLYSGLVDRVVPLKYGDFFKEKITQAIYRVTSRPEETQAPESAAIRLKSFTAERTRLPK